MLMLSEASEHPGHINIFVFDMTDYTFSYFLRWTKSFAFILVSQLDL